jgi:hypothetical protein
MPVASRSSTAPERCSCPTTSPRRHLARLPDQGRPDPRLGQARRDPGQGVGHPGRVLARPDPRPRPQPHGQGRDLPGRPRHRRPGHPDPVPRRGDRALHRAHPPRRGHHLGHRQRAARLQHRPVPDPRAGHQRQDALGRPADERRRPVRDGRRRLGPQARAAADGKENYLRWDSLGEFLALAESFRHEATNGNARAGVLGECLDRATERLLNEDKSPPAGSARSTTAAATSGSPASGPRSSRSRRRTPSSPPGLRSTPVSRRQLTTPTR